MLEKHRRRENAVSPVELRVRSWFFILFIPFSFFFFPACANCKYDRSIFNFLRLGSACEETRTTVGFIYFFFFKGFVDVSIFVCIGEKVVNRSRVE